MSDQELTTESRVDWRQMLVGLALLAALGWGIYRAIELRWISDDAFISFRYAKHLVEGHGLVFNVGEYVEGYTNFLWTMLIAAAVWLQLDPVTISWGLGIVSFGVTAVLLVYASTRFYSDRFQASVLILPLAAIGFLLMTVSQQFATSGLETMFLTMLLTLGAILLAKARTAGAILNASLVLTLGALTRPDALLFVAMGFVFLLLAGPDTRRRAWLYLLPMLLLYAPYWWWRFDYYGQIFPNTYYAKSAYLAWWSQGWAYVKLFFSTYYALLLIVPAALVIKLPMFKTSFKRWEIVATERRLGILTMLMVFPYLVYVLRVGGDFMFGRFLIPIVPLMLLMIETALWLIVRSGWLRLVVAIFILAGLALPFNQFNPPTAFIDGIADEPSHYDTTKLAQDKALGTQLGSLWNAVAEKTGTEPVIAFYGTFAALVYYSDPTVAIEANAGLTDEYIAHQELSERGRPGHEKQAEPEYLAGRGVNFLYVGTPPIRTELDKLRQINFGRFKSFILTYDPDLMTTLRRDFPQVSFTTMPEFLADYVNVMQEMTDEMLARDYAYLSGLYFEQMPELREARFELPGAVGDYFRYLRDRNIIRTDTTGQ